jgi:glycine/D-amino acid oxidase-like deaminating enzyme
LNDRIAIVGAGIAGACLAYRLARSGHAVLVIDDGRLGRATSWNPGGINPLHGPGFPGAMAGIYRDAYGLHLAQQKEVRAASGIDFGWRVVDRLFLAADEGEADKLRGLAPHYETFGHDFCAYWMSAGEIAGWDARVGSAWLGGLMTRGNVRVDSERYRLALLAAATRLGATIVTARARRLETQGGRIAAIDWGEGPVPVSALCMATGAFAGRDIDGWSPGPVAQVSPAIGDLLLVRSPEEPLLADISYGLKAIYQHDQNYFWIGGTVRAAGPLGETDPDTERALLDGARALMPGWAAPNVVGRSSAARPATVDALPVVGRSPRYENGWIINGLGGKGILLSAWAADAVAQMIDGGPDIDFLSPNRTIEETWQKITA